MRNDNQPIDLAKSKCIPPLSKFQWTQLILLASSYSMAFASVTLVMSKAPLIVQSTGGSGSIGPISIALYELGKCLVVLPVGPTARRFGRKTVFILGGLLGLISSTMGILGVEYSVPYLILLATLFSGLSAGVSYGYRFAAIEIVPDHREFAVTFCLSGGILGAVIGPVSATYAKDLFDKENLAVYLINFIFATTMLILSTFLRLDQHVEKVQNDVCEGRQPPNKFTLSTLLANKTFLFGCIASTMSWVCMNLPMSLVGVAMEDETIKDNNVMLAFICHFMGMFLPGFGTSRLIASFGLTLVGLLSVASFSLATTLNLIAQGDDAVLWIIGQFFVGLGWNLGFSTATVMISRCCPPEDRQNATVFQAYNDFISFFIDGLITISTGYIYEARGGGVGGWRFLNYILIMFIGIKLVNVLVNWWVNGRHNNIGNQANKCTIDMGSPDDVTKHPCRRHSSVEFMEASLHL